MREAAPVQVVTVVPRHRLERARALEAAIAALHPSWRVVVATAEEAPAPAVPYEEDELCAALKPWALRRALDGGAPVALYVDAGARVTGPLEALAGAAAERGVALVPRPEVATDPLGALEQGVFDTQLLGVGPRGRPFLDWLADRVERECLRRPANGLWLDQRWLGAALAFFDAAIVRGLPVEPAPRVATPSEPRGIAEQPSAPPPDPGPPPIAELAPGANLVVRSGRDEPLDELASALAASLERLGVPVATIGYRPGDAERPLEGIHPRLAPYDAILVCLNPLDLLGFAFHVDAELFERRRAIGVWLAEGTPAPDLDAALSFLDEIWVPSESAARGLAARTNLPVAVLPPTVATDLGPRPELPGSPVVLTVCDLADVFAPGALDRANPLGLIEAFERAFAPGEGPTLVVRLVDGARNRLARERVRLASERSDVVVLDGPLAAADRRALVRACDCYATLHRASDFEVAVAEALAAGRAVVSTATETVRGLGGALLVPASAEPVPPGLATFWTEETWSEPDLDEAARLLRRALEDPGPPRAARPSGLDDFLWERMRR